MCGIAGAINFKLSYPKIKSVMGHRGPDEQNGLTIDRIDYYHLRLSILDIAGGKQPMQIGDRYYMVYNGEIYNHLELRNRFGLKAVSNSDTETLLLMYEKMGIQMLEHLDGMFVFSIYDRQEKKLCLARDRSGKKPLYYYRDQEKLLFASELNCLKASVPLEIQHNNFYHYLRFGSFYKAQTPYKNVSELVAGTYMVVDCETLDISVEQWWNIQPFFLQDHQDDLQTALEKTEHYLNQGVQRRMQSSDLEVGCFLSGGIDSALVTAFASRYARKLKTLTVSFDGQYDEAPLAKLLSDQYQTEHTEIKITYDHLVNDVEGIISAYGEPFFDSSAIPSYYVSKAAKQKVTVVLTGDGADELYGGYRRYVPFAKHDFFKQKKWLTQLAAMVKGQLPVSHEKKSLYNHLYRSVSFASKEGLDIYLSAGLDISEDYEQNFLQNSRDCLREVVEDFERITATSVSGLKKIMNLDFDIFLYNDVLVKMDIATMRNSLEARSPFLCKEILEYAPGLKDELKVKGKQTKYLLRILAEKYLPKELIDQPKMGFEVPLKQWVNHELREMVFDYVGYSKAFHKDKINQQFISKLLEDRINMPAEKRAKLLWTVFSMEVWYQKNILNTP